MCEIAIRHKHRNINRLIVYILSSLMKTMHIKYINLLYNMISIIILHCTTNNNGNIK